VLQCELGQESCEEASCKALGVLAVMEKFMIYFGLKLSFLVFSAMEQLSKTLQYKDINAQQIFSAMDAAKQFLERQRNTNAFSTFYASVLHEAQDLTEEPKLPKQKRIPSRINDGAPNHHFHIPEDYFTQQYTYFDFLSIELSKYLFCSTRN